MTIPSSHANKPNSTPPSPQSIPSPSPSTNLVSDQAADDHVLIIPLIQTLFPPHTNISISQPPPHANYKSVPSTSLNNRSNSILPTSASHEQLLRDCNYTPRPRPEAEVVVLDSDTEAESSYKLNREPQPYFFPNPIFSRYSIGELFEKAKRNLRSIFDTLRIAESSGLSDVAMRNLWRIFRKESDVLLLELQEVCAAAAPRPRGILRNYEDFWFARLRGRYLLEEKPFVDEMEQLRLAA